MSRPFLAGKTIVLYCSGWSKWQSKPVQNAPVCTFGSTVKFLWLPAKLSYNMYAFWLVVCFILLSRNICWANFFGYQPNFHTIYMYMYSWLTSSTCTCGTDQPLCLFNCTVEVQCTCSASPDTSVITCWSLYGLPCSAMVKIPGF